jgi:hypothetical protein
MRFFFLYLAPINAKWDQRGSQIRGISGWINRKGAFMGFTDITDNATFHRSGLAFPA